MFVGSSGRDPFSSNAVRVSPFLRQLEETQRSQLAPPSSSSMKPYHHISNGNTYLPPPPPVASTSALNTSMHVLELPYHSIVGSTTHYHLQRTSTDDKNGGGDTVLPSTARAVQVSDAHSHAKVSIQSPTLLHTYFVDPLSQSHPQQPQATRFMSPTAASWGHAARTPTLFPKVSTRVESSASRATLESKSLMQSPPPQEIALRTTRRLLQAPPQSPPPASKSLDQREPQWSELVTRLMAPSFLSPSHKKSDANEVSLAAGGKKLPSPPHRYAATATEATEVAESTSVPQISNVTTGTVSARTKATTSSSLLAPQQRYAPLPPPDLVSSYEEEEIVESNTDVIVSTMLATPSKRSHHVTSDISSSEGGALASPISVRHDDSKASVEDFATDGVTRASEMMFVSPRRPPPPPPPVEHTNASSDALEHPVRQAPSLPATSVEVHGVLRATSTTSTWRRVKVTAEATSSKRESSHRNHHHRPTSSTPSSNENSSNAVGDDDGDDSAVAARVAEAYAYDCFVRDASYYMHPVLAKALHSREVSDRNTLQDNQVIELGNVCIALQLMLARSKLVKVEQELRSDIVVTSDRIIHNIATAARDYVTATSKPVTQVFTPQKLSSSILTATPSPLTLRSAQMDPIAEALLAPAIPRATPHQTKPKPAAVKSAVLSDDWVDTGSWLLSDRSPERRHRRVQSSLFTSPNNNELRVSTQRPLNVAEYLLGAQKPLKQSGAEDASFTASTTAASHSRHIHLGPVRPKASVAILAAAITVPTKRSASRESSPPDHVESHPRHDQRFVASRVAIYEELAAFHKVHVAPSRTVVINEEPSIPRGEASAARSPSLRQVAAAVASPPSLSERPHRLQELRDAILAEELSDSSTSSRSTTPTKLQSPTKSTVTAPVATNAAQSPAAIMLEPTVAPMAQEDDHDMEEVHVRLSASTSLGSLSVDGVSE